MEGIDLRSLLLSMRSYRMGLIQTYDQLKFSYMAIIAGGRQLTASTGAQQVNNVLDNYLENRVHICCLMLLFVIFSLSVFWGGKKFRNCDHFGVCISVAVLLSARTVWP